jgi:hypothetical protein
MGIHPHLVSTEDINRVLTRLLPAGSLLLEGAHPTWEAVAPPGDWQIVNEVIYDIRYTGEPNHTGTRVFQVLRRRS